MVMHIQYHSRQAYVSLQPRCYSQISLIVEGPLSTQQHQPYSNDQQLVLFILMGYRRCLPDYHDVLHHDLFFTSGFTPPQDGK